MTCREWKDALVTVPDDTIIELLAPFMEGRTHISFVAEMFEVQNSGMVDSSKQRVRMVNVNPCREALWGYTFDTAMLEERAGHSDIPLTIRTAHSGMMRGFVKVLEKDGTPLILNACEENYKNAVGTKITLLLRLDPIKP